MKGIITADFHLRKLIPRCRLDEDWIGLQRKVVQAIVKATHDHECSMTIVGDIFHTTRQSPEIINMTIEELQKANREVFVFPGNHDLPYHQYENEHQSAFGILKRIFIELTNPKNPSVLFIHELIWPDAKTKPGPAPGKTAEELLEAHPDADWIFTGDYHRRFHFEKDGRHVVNPGCITRQAADFTDYIPSIYYVDTEKGLVEMIPLPDDEASMITDKYLRDEEQRDERLEAFISTVMKTGKVNLDFLENLRMKVEGLEPDVKAILLEVIEEVS